MKQNSPYVAIIDYQMSNLYSVKHACDAIGLSAILTSKPSELMAARAAILPGVGAFGDAMEILKKLGLITPIKTFIGSGRQFMGVCLGMQLLFTESPEFGLHKGLEIIEGDVIKFAGEIKVPQIGWNTIYRPQHTVWRGTPLSGVRNHSYMYFVHSYYVKPKNRSVILSYTSYGGIAYCSTLEERNVFAVQFHPEKSGDEGIGMYKNCLR